ncbi:hypothetical protein THRCLA_21304 [Thraustotheca clavata]|uniref:HECT domain-containing protein n=1 Tax=Thraustotheca clavata TaxID=74557 RepID=A0A1V9ZXZ0_9STRA|nr:hypothetical protein THRCLA_21304 [Thraustotheca clavata]
METWLLVLDIALGLVGLFLCFVFQHTKLYLKKSIFVGNFYDGLQRQDLEDPLVIHYTLYWIYTRQSLEMLSVQFCQQRVHNFLCNIIRALNIRTTECKSEKTVATWYDSKGYCVWQTLTANAKNYFIINFNNGNLCWDELSIVNPGEYMRAWKYDYLIQLQNISFSSKYASFYSNIESLGLPYTKFNYETKITMIGESEVDAGGFQREWYSLAFKSIFDPSRGLFIINNKEDNAYMINANLAQDQ